VAYPLPPNTDAPEVRVLDAFDSPSDSPSDAPEPTKKKKKKKKDSLENS
jgi:hypothetical protein